jgi:hypothetical protein
MMQGKEVFLYFKTVTPRLGPTQQSVMEQLGLETDHSPPTSAELKNDFNSYLHSPLYLYRQQSVRIKLLTACKSNKL